MTSARRWWTFNGVSAIGVGVQLASLAVLTRAGVPYQLATPAAVGVAVVHNFLWHRVWTWRDRATSPGNGAAAFTRFVMANGLVSLAGNVALMPLLVDGLSLPVLAANLLAIAACGLANFWIGDRFVFAA